jgi:hypothetical protein
MGEEMRGKVAKMLRKAVYGDRSLRQTEYGVRQTNKFRTLLDKLTGKTARLYFGSVEADKYRKMYQFFKKEWNAFNTIERSKGKHALKKISAPGRNVPESTGA